MKLYSSSESHLRNIITFLNEYASKSGKVPEGNYPIREDYEKAQQLFTSIYSKVNQQTLRDTLLRRVYQAIV